MSKTESISDILSDLRSDTRRFSNSVAAAIADRIDMALGSDAATNGYVMRELLLEISRMAGEAERDGDPFRVHQWAVNIGSVAHCALQYRPRNCDIYLTPGAAVAAYLDHTKDGALGPNVEGIVDWLYAKAGMEAEKK